MDLVTHLRAPRASWWRRLLAWRRIAHLAERLDIRARRIALLAEYPWATWTERRDLARAMLAESDMAQPVEALATRALVTGQIRMKIMVRGTAWTVAVFNAHRICRDAYQRTQAWRGR